jgi:hypothetical protein
MVRIKGATPDSQIAVFRCDEPENLNAVFAATVITRRMIDEGHRDLIGVYDGTMNLGDIERELRSHVRYAA